MSELMVEAVTPQQSPKLSAEERAISEVAIDAFIEALGGRAQAVETLRIGSGDPRVDAVLARMEETHCEPLRRSCTRVGLTVADFFLAFQRAMFARAHLLTSHIITETLVPIVQDVMRRAAPYEEPCTCLPAKRDACPKCRGTGIRQILPPIDRQKVALQLGKLLADGAPLVQTNIVNAPVTTPGPLARGSLTDLTAAVTEALKPRRALPTITIDATPEHPATPVPESP